MPSNNLCRVCRVVLQIVGQGKVKQKRENKETGNVEKDINQNTGDNKNAYKKDWLNAFTINQAYWDNGQ